MKLAFIGAVGLPNRYGGFESFLEQCAPTLVRHGHQVIVTCDASAYQDDRSPTFREVERIFLKVRANGAMSILHDAVAFAAVFARADRIVVLGVSGGIFFPLFRALCALTGKRLLINIDGVEWRRTKFSPTRRLVLRLFDSLAQTCSHGVIYDNSALLPFVLSSARAKARLIAYSGDHVLRLPDVTRLSRTALTICRIEPENNIDMVIAGALGSGLDRYTVIGNWNGSPYGRELKARHADNPRLLLVDPVYDPSTVARHREECAIYIHGHSVGGTNPSLVEILFYDCAILCYDCNFNRETAGASAEYFGNAQALSALINRAEATPSSADDRAATRQRFTASAIATAYEDAIASL